MRFSRQMIVAAAIAMVSAATAAEAAIAPGNLVVYRVGNGSAALGTTATAVFLDEYTTTGTLVQSISVPSLTAIGNASTEGIISPSQDGTKLVYAGYRTAAGVAPVAADRRTIGTIDLAGTADTTIDLTTAVGTPRSATTVNGSTYYMGSSTNVYYIGAPGAGTTATSVDARNSRQVFVADNVLFSSNGSTAITGKVQHYGVAPTGTTAATPVATLALADAVNGIYLLDLSNSVAGVDTLYALSTIENLIRKYSFDGTTWTATGSIGANSAQNLVATIAGSGVNIYTTTGGSIRAMTDSSGYNGTLSGTTSVIVTAGTNTAFRGIGILPEPTSLTALAGMLVMGRRRKA